MRSWMLSTFLMAAVVAGMAWAPAAAAEESPAGAVADAAAPSAASPQGAAEAAAPAAGKAPSVQRRIRSNKAGGKKPGRVAKDVGPYELVQPPPEGSGPTDAEEQFQLAKTLMYGIDTEGRPHNAEGRPAEALVWYLKAAEQGHARAQANVAMAYLKGRGTEQNYDEAIRWLDSAALLGSAKAMLELGLLYRDGDGVPKDPVRGVTWLLLASQQGSLVANMVSAGSVKQLTPDQRQEALRRAREWREEHGHPTLRPNQKAAPAQKAEPAPAQAASDEPPSDPSGPPS